MSSLQSSGWNNLNTPQEIQLVQPGGALYGTGNSNHGWGLALDLCFRKYDGDDAKMGEDDYPNTDERKWVADFGGKFGFEGLFTKDKTIPKQNGYTYLGETWHLNYTGQISNNK